MFSSFGAKDDDILVPKMKSKTPFFEYPGQKTDEFYIQRIQDKERFVVCMTTDKSRYKPGETVFCRSIILNAFDRKTFGCVGYGVSFFAKFKSPTGDVIKEGAVDIPRGGVISFQYTIPSDRSGGEYKIELIQKGGSGVPAQEISFDVEKYSPPRFKKELEFLQKAYGEGDEVKALLKVSRSEGGFCDPSKTKIEAIGRLDGKEFFRNSFNLDASGKSMILFNLPQQIEEGIGSLTCIVSEGMTESITKTLPVVLKKLTCHMYPEGGDLICGIKNGVYCAALTPSSEPADFEADLIASKSKKEEVVCEVKTLHEGRGYFEFIPKEGFNYYLRVKKPSGVTHPIALPEIKKNGVCMFLKEKKVLKFGENIEMMINSRGKVPKEVYVGLFKKEVLIDSMKIALSSDNNNEPSLVKLKPKENDGILRVTCFFLDGNDYAPLCERLVFVKLKNEFIQFEVNSQRKAYAPRDTVELSIKANVDNVFACVTVTDDSVIKMKEKRKRACRLPGLFFLNNEVEELNDPQSYFQEDEDDLRKVSPDQKMELLLGTQGWRRFLYKNMKEVMDTTDEKERMERLFCIHFEKPQIVPPPIAFGGGGGMIFRARGAMPRRAMAMAPPRAMLADGLVNKVKAIPQKPRKMKAMVPKNAAMNMPAPPPPPPVPQLQQQIAPPKPIAGKMDIRMEGRKPMMMKKRKIMCKPKRPPQPATFCYIREFAHKIISKDVVDDSERTDFSETLYFNASTLLKNKKQETKITFDLGDAISSFRVLIDGFSADGQHIGYSESFCVNVEKFFYAEPKVPLELSFGDEFYLPLSVVSNMEKEIDVQLDASVNDMDLLDSTGSLQLKMQARERKGIYIGMKVNPTNELKKDLRLNAFVQSNERIKDDVKKEFVVTPTGFPLYFNSGGQLVPGESVNFKIPMPETIHEHSLETLGYFYPSPLSNLTTSLSSLIRSPCGCFEQTSMTMYPMIMAVNYFKTHKDEDGKGEELVKKANEHLDSGYKRLIGYECSKGGFEWFGSDPGHEALTSMGIMEFTDLSKIYPVDQEMIKRTNKWLMNRLNEKQKKFERNEKALDSFGRAPTETTDAYICYALSRSGIEYKKIEMVVDRLYEEAKKEHNDDSYFISLVGLMLFNFGKEKEAKEITKSLLDFQTAVGAVERSKASITNSGGSNLLVETTSLTLLNFLNFPKDFSEEAELGIAWLNTQNNGGRFGSTQATILALEAIIKFDEVCSSPQEDGSVEMFVNGKLAQTKEFTSEITEEIVFDDFSKDLELGKENEIELKMKDGSKMPFSIQLSMTTEKPLSQETNEKLFYDLSLKDNVLTEGESTEVEVIIQNKKVKEGLPMTLAVISLPSGMKPRMEKLKELKKSKVVSNFELFGAREVVLYFTCMKPNEKKKILFDVEAYLPGKFKARCSRAYLYYDDDNTVYKDGLECEIKTKDK